MIQPAIQTRSRRIAKDLLGAFSGFITSLLTAVTLMASIETAYAKTDSVFCKFKYVLGDNDTKHEAKKIAFIEAKRLCLEKVGTILESESTVSSFQLTKDEVRTYAFGFLKAEVVSEKIMPSGETMTIQTKVRVDYDPDVFTAKLREIKNNQDGATEFQRIQEQKTALERQVKDLQQELASSKTDEEIVRLRKERNAALSQYEAIASNIENLTISAMKRIRGGMTISEVVRLMGQPRSQASSALGYEALNYGELWVCFMNGLVTGYVPIEKWQGAVTCGVSLKKF